MAGSSYLPLVKVVVEWRRREGVFSGLCGLAPVGRLQIHVSPAGDEHALHIVADTVVRHAAAVYG